MVQTEGAVWARQAVRGSRERVGREGRSEWVQAEGRGCEDGPPAGSDRRHRGCQESGGRHWRLLAEGGVITCGFQKHPCAGVRGGQEGTRLGRRRPDGGC